jgi:hypothetical protein
MNTYFISLLQEKKGVGHSRPLLKFLKSLGETCVTLRFGGEKKIMVSVESLFNEVIWYMQLPDHNVNYDVIIGDKNLINFYLLGMQFKKRNLALRLTDHILQNQF